VGDAMFSPDSARVVTLSADRTARIWSVDGASAPVILTGHRAKLSGVDWSPSGDRLVTASLDGVLRSWSTDGWTLSAEARAKPGARKLVYVYLDREGKRVIVTDGTGDILLWNAAEGGDLVLLGHHDAGAQMAAWSPDGFRVATASADKTARIWDV